ncbi:unnamed protein product [Vicia faba]|uniref:Uncharacterized protein n=1 Tax=Vicia faba TaxID=3906 RepID=A0AAV1A3D3_VICFA|nr:unnamed protein product [Vicia faba]
MNHPFFFCSVLVIPLPFCYALPFSQKFLLELVFTVRNWLRFSVMTVGELVIDCLGGANGLRKFGFMFLILWTFRIGAVMESVRLHVWIIDIGLNYCADPFLMHMAWCIINEWLIQEAVVGSRHGWHFLV